MTPFTSQELRKGFSSFATGVTVITCLDSDQQAHGITISSFNTVSLEPPLILWSLKKHSRLMPNFEVGHKQLIHVLARSQESMAMHFATVKENQFLDIPHQIAASGLTQIDGCAAYFECETVSVHLGGDHNIIVAKVLHLKHSPDSQPLIYAHSKFVGIDSPH
jgi:flavin reductase (DIM6/NTAB) family NADH-FMN oxidoreductase RutF